jgi:hypothetical protein
MHKCSVADPGSGIGCFFDPWIRDGRKSASESGMINPDHIFLSLETIFLVSLGLNYLFFDEDPGWSQFGSGILDPGWKKVGSGIRDKNPGSATLLKCIPLYNIVEVFLSKVSY